MILNYTKGKVYGKKLEVIKNVLENKKAEDNEIIKIDNDDYIY